MSIADTHPLHAFTIVGLSIFLLVLISVTESELNGIKAQAIERGYAVWCPPDGEWAWAGECAE